MGHSPQPRPLAFLLLLFTGTLCTSMVIPYMAYFLVQGLGQQPWTISVYTGLAITVTVTANRRFAARLDAGEAAVPLIAVAISGYLLASIVLGLAPGFWTAVLLAAPGFGIASSAVSTMFSLGGGIAEGRGVARNRFNAHMRATTSTGWMMGPALGFLIADLAAPQTVFLLGIGLAAVWAVLLRHVLPRDVRLPQRPAPAAEGMAGTGTTSTALWMAVGFVFCLSAAHGLSFTALPLFYVQEVGLPGYAPGTAFSIKTFVEVFAILSTPMLIARFGLRTALIGTTLLAVVAIQVLAAVQSFPGMVLGAALEGLYYGLYASLGISFVQSLTPDAPARATALYWNTLMISGLLAGPAVGLIAQAADFRSALHVATGVAVLGLLVLLAARGRTARVS